MKFKILFDAIFLLSVSLCFTFLPVKVADSFNRLLEFALKGKQQSKVLPSQIRFVGIVGIVIGLILFVRAGVLN